MDKAYKIKNSRCLCGSIFAPPSKSVLHRQIICASLSDKESIIENYIPCDDTEATLNVVKTLGACYKVDGTTLKISPITAPVQSAVLECGESGSTARFIAPIAAALGCDFSLSGVNRLPYRPMNDYSELFEKHGTKVVLDVGKREFFKSKGKLSGSQFDISGELSSQFITGLLLACPLMETDVTINVTGVIKSRGYIEITLDVMRSFGVDCSLCGNTIHVKKGKYIGGKHIAEGDYSGSAFMLCAGVLFGKVEIDGLFSDSSQGDREIVDIIRAFGGDIKRGQNKLIATKSSLVGVCINAEDIPDLVPCIALLGAFANGKTEIFGVERLRFKESDRIASVVTSLSALGADIKYENNAIIIIGKKELSGGCADSFTDHRIAMMCCVAAAGCSNEVILTTPCVVGKSYPAFYDDYEKLGGKIDVICLGKES